MKPYAERLAEAQAYNRACKVKPHDPRQKLPRGTKIKLTGSRFECENRPHRLLGDETNKLHELQYAIIQYSYSQKYHGDDFNNYSVLLVNQDKEVFNSLAWVSLDELEVISEPTEETLALLHSYEEVRG